MTSSPLPRAAAPLALALAVAASGCAAWHATRAAQRQRDQLARLGVRLGPTRAIDGDELATRVTCEAPGPAEVTCGFDRAWALYDQRGHPQARFSLRAVDPPEGGVTRELVVEEGPYFWVERVRVDGLEDVAAAPAWLRALPLRPGEPFSAWLFTQAKDELLAALHGAGYGAAEVFERMQPDLQASVPGAYAVVARFDVDPGRPGARWPLGALEVRDPDAARRARLERELAPLLPVGQPFDYARFAEARARLAAIPTAEVLVGKADEARRDVQVVVRVER